MEVKDIATPSRTKAILKKYHLEAKKSLGQNFVVDPSILQRMVRSAEVDGDSQVIEVGPGIGALTEQIAKVAKSVLAFEVDQRLIPVLEDTLSTYDNVTVVLKDILQVDLEEEVGQKLSPQLPIRVVANLPYYITTPIIMAFVECELPVETYALMMQKEVAERMTAQPNSKAYGSLTIALDYYCETKIGFIVPRTVFEPRPNVDSAVLNLQRRPQPKVAVVDEAHFFELVRNSFGQRRKTLWNNLIAAYGKDEVIKNKIENALQKAKIDPKRRAETVTIEEFASLSNALVTR